MEATNLKRRSTAKGVPFLLLGVAFIIAAIVFVIMNPGILENLLYLAIIIAIVIVAIVVIGLAVIMILAIPFYLFKGEQYQDGVSYDIKDVNAVRESSSEDKDKKE
jgi:membrane protein YdbS with pleckstrin-like domain